jgi:hypothetical protein
VHADIRISEVPAVRRDGGVVAFIEDGIKMDGRGHKFHVGRNVLWKIIFVASLRRENA